MSISFFFFFKQKTAYDMRISDWSSDVCSSELSAEVDFALIPKYAHLFGGINGDVNKTSFKTLTRENPWLAALGSTNGIRNSVDRLNIFGGIDRKSVV